MEQGPFALSKLETTNNYMDDRETPKKKKKLKNLKFVEVKYIRYADNLTKNLLYQA
jgi:hypothetical protein